MYLDIERMKKEVTMAHILALYGITLRQTGEDRLAGCCPIHHGDNQNAFHVDLFKNLFHCFTHCGGGSIFDFVMKKENLSFYRAALKIWKTFYTTPHQETSQHQTSTIKLQYHHPYLCQRGIDEKVARYFRIGYSQSGLMKNRIAIPIIDRNNKLIAYCGRAIDQHTSPKYLFPRNFNKSKHLFNIQSILPTSPKPVFVVEGFFDCLHLLKLGFDAVALMGNSISQNQLEILKQLDRPYILMLDGDEAGRKGMEKAKQLMKRETLPCKSVYLVDVIEPESLGYDFLKILESENFRY
jgi:DNA primase